MQGMHASSRTAFGRFIRLFDKGARRLKHRPSASSSPEQRHLVQCAQAHQHGTCLQLPRLTAARLYNGNACKAHTPERVTAPVALRLQDPQAHFHRDVCTPLRRSCLTHKRMHYHMNKQQRGEWYGAHLICHIMNLRCRSGLTKRRTDITTSWTCAAPAALLAPVQHHHSHPPQSVVTQPCCLPQQCPGLAPPTPAAPSG